MSTAIGVRVQGSGFREESSKFKVQSSKLDSIGGETQEIGRALLIATGVIVGIAFFISHHEFTVSRSVAYTQSAEEMELAASGGNALRRVAFLGLGAWGLMLFAIGKQRLNIDWPLMVALALLAAVATVSCVWADDPGMCLRRLMILYCSGLAAAGIARTHTLRDLSWMVMVLLGTLAVIGLLAEVALGTFRPWGGDYRFAGTVHPNTQGPALATMCFAALGIINEKGRSRWWLWGIFLAGVLLLLMTKSRTTAAAFFASVAAVQLVRLPLSMKVSGALAAVWLGVVGLWIVWLCGFDPTTDFRDAVLLGRAEESDTLSGRAFIWPEVMRFVQERPLLGYGYESFWTPARIEVISSELGWGLREAHNGYLEMLLWLGWTGLLLTLVATAAGLAAAVRGFLATKDSAYTLPIALLVFGLINSGLESGMVVITTVPFLLACCLLRLGLFADVADVGCKSGAHCTSVDQLPLNGAFRTAHAPYGR
jgi:exopolysaccharide production protein ExoQ